MKSLTKLLATGILTTSLALSAGCSKRDQNISIEKISQEASERQDTTQAKSLSDFFATKKSKSQHEYLDINLAEDVSLRFVRIPGGDYPLENGGVEILKPYWIMETELTELQYKAMNRFLMVKNLQSIRETEEGKKRLKEMSSFMGISPEKMLAKLGEDSSKEIVRDEKDNYPHLDMTIMHGTYIRELRKALSKNFDLATEFQFYYALSEGNPIGFLERARPIYEKGNILPKDGIKKLKPVKSFPPNKFGLYDLIGNANEIFYPFWGFDSNGKPIINDNFGYFGGGSYQSNDQKEIFKKSEAKDEHGVRLVINE